MAWKLSNEERDKNSVIHILHVDDDPCLLDVTKAILELHPDIKVHSANSVDEAFSKIATNSYDVIISDYQMPIKDGLEFLKEIRENGSKIPFIIFTGKGREEVAVKALNLGAFRYMHKTGDPETVYAELVTAIRQAATNERIENSLQQKTHLSQVLLDAIPCVALLLRPKTREIVASNKAAIQVGAIPGKKCYSTWGKRDTPCPWCLAPNLWANGKSQQLEIECNDVVWDAYWIPVSPDLYMHYAFDITSRKKAEAQIIENERRWAATLASIGDAVIVTDNKGKIKFMNKVSEQLTGWNLSEVKDKPIQYVFRIINEETKKMIEEPVAKVLREGTSVGLANHTLLLCKDGHEIPIDDSGSPVKNKDGKITGTVLVFRDITARKKAEKELQSSEKKYRALFENMIDGYAYCQMLFDEKGLPDDFVYLQVNNAFEKLTGLKVQDVIGKRVTQAIPRIKQDNPQLFDTYGKVALTGIPTHFEVYFKPLSIWLDTSVFSPQKGYFVAVFENITERKVAEIQMQKLNRSLKALAKSNQALLRENDETEYAKKVCSLIVNDCGYALAFVSVAEQDKDKTIKQIAYAGGDKQFVDNLQLTWANTERCLGPTGSAIKTGRVQVHLALNLPSFNPCRNDAVARKFQSAVAFPLKDQEITFGALSIYSTEENFSAEEIKLLTELSEDFAFGIVSIRLRKTKAQSDEALEMQALLLNLSPNAIVVKRADNTITFWSEGAERLYGWLKEEAIGKDAQQLLKTEYPLDFINIVKGVKNNEYWTGELVQQTKDNRKITVQSFWLSIFDKHSKNISVVLQTDLDITERKNAEEQLIEKQTELAIINEKLRVVGRLTRHDICNKVAAIQGYLHITENKLSKGENITPILTKMETSAEKITEIFEFERDYEKIGAEKLYSIDVGYCVQAAIALLTEKPENIKINNRCQGLSVKADSLLSKVFYNLIDNSLRHGKSVKAIDIQCQKSSEGISIIYSDDGIGITKEGKLRLFKEGYSTAGGSGYGMYLIKKIIQFYGWSITETGNSGKGVKFIMKVPKNHCKKLKGQ